MGYMHIDNLYKNQEILLFRECYALEKIHGTSAHIGWDGREIKFFSGGSSHKLFVSLFDIGKLATKFMESGSFPIVIYGEAYGGSMQGMSATYGKELKFVAFDVLIGEKWLSVPQAEAFVIAFGLEFVHYSLIPTVLELIDKERDTPSVQARRNGILDDKQREGVVLRPPIELRKNNDERIICKHKHEQFAETNSKREVISPEKLAVLAEADKIAEEWVTEMRLTHVLDKFPSDVNMESMTQIIAAMKEDVLRESVGEIVVSKDAIRAIGKRTALLFKDRLKQNLVLVGSIIGKGE